MQPSDTVKLIYQNEFGGEHLIENPDQCLRLLQQEYQATPRNRNQSLLEEIGNGIVRVMLAGLDTDLYSIEALNRAFVLSAQYHKGSQAAFHEKLNLLRKMTIEYRFRFSYDELNVYLQEYDRAGYPMLSHSDQYRKAYHPAYRVVERKML